MTKRRTYPIFDTPSPRQLILKNYLIVVSEIITLVVPFRGSVCLLAGRIARKQRDR